jgi:DprA winged helix domain
MNAAASRQASATRTWAAWIPRERVDARHNRPLAAATDRQRVLLLALEFLWKSRPYTFTSNDELAAFTGWDVRKVQRTLEELELDGFIHRELIAGRTDRVSGRPSVTGRVAIIALARLSDQPVATPGKDLDQVLADIRLDRERRQPPTVPFDRAMGARQICHRVHDNFGEGCTTNLSSPLCMEKERQENTTTNSDGGPSSSSILLLEPEPEPAGDCVAEVPEDIVASEPPAADTSTHLPVPSPAPVELPPAPAVAVVAAELPAELVAAAAEAIPDASWAWVRSLLRDCGSYGLDLALLVVAWVKIQRAEKPRRYARVALGGWLNQLRSGELTLEDVRGEVHGRTGPRAGSRPFDPAACLARMGCSGWELVAVGPELVKWSEKPGWSACLWKQVSSDLREQVEEHKAELKAYVLKRAAERGKTVAIRA